MKVLVIAPHPDDEVLGCGGTIAKFSQRGDEIHRLIVTDVYEPDWSKDYRAQKAEEIRAAGGILGIQSTVSLGFPAVRLDTIPQKDLNDAIAGVVRDAAPDLAFIPHRGDLNRDHRIVFEAALVALRPVGSRCRKVLSYEVPSETEWGRPLDPFVPGVYVDITGTIDTKIRAMETYRTEVKAPPHPRSPEILRALARVRGSEVLVPSAEAYALVREIMD
jgi:LmbE family N-acetylglucosaminyl deacetylase